MHLNINQAKLNLLRNQEGLENLGPPASPAVKVCSDALVIFEP